MAKQNRPNPQPTRPNPSNPKSPVPNKMPPSPGRGSEQQKGTPRPPIRK